MTDRLTMNIDDREVVWQGFASCTSFILLIEDKLQYFQHYKNDLNNNFKCDLIALEFNSLYVMLNEQIVSWIIAIGNWFKDKNKTLLWNLCRVSTREINDFTKQLSDNYTEITNNFLEPYLFNLKPEEKSKMQGKLRERFHILFSYGFFGGSEDGKELNRAFRQIHDKTKHGYILFDVKQFNSLCVPDGKYSNEITVESKDISKIMPVVLNNRIDNLKMMYQNAILAVSFFQYIIAFYSLNRFGETNRIKNETLNQVKQNMKANFLEYVEALDKLSLGKTIEHTEKFVAEFENCTLPKYQWTHQAHFHVGIFYLLKYSKEIALEKIRENIKKYNVSTGVQNTETDGYHETITRFYLWAINKFILEEDKVKEFNLNLVHKLAKSKIIKKDFPYTYYSKELLLSKEARLGWVEPDIRPLD